MVLQTVSRSAGIEYFIVYSLALLLCAGIVIVPVGASEPSIIVSDWNVTPSVLMPGDRGLITVTLTSTSTNALVTETSRWPASADLTVSTSQEINPTIQSVYLDGEGDIRVLGGNSQFTGDLGPGQSVRLVFSIEAPATNGIYYTVLRVSVRNGEMLRYPIPVNVNLPISTIRQPRLIMEQSPGDYLMPGTRYNVSFSLANLGRATASDISLRIEENNPSLAPLGARGFHIDQLVPGETARLSFGILSDKTAPSGLHAMPVRVGYSLPDGERIEQDETITIDVRGLSELSITSVKTDPVAVRKGDPFQLIIRMENTGTTEAKSTVARIDLPARGSREAFVGTIKPGNNAPALFQLTTETAGDIDYNFSVSYQDDRGVHQIERTLHITVEETDISGLVLLVVIGIGIAGYLGYRWITRGRRQQRHA